MATTLTLYQPIYIRQNKNFNWIIQKPRKSFMAFIFATFYQSFQNCF